MRTRILLVILATALMAALIACIALTAETPTPQIVVPCRVIDGYRDGDTLTAEVTLRMRVRLIDCWAPEITGKEKTEGLKSKKRLEELALGKTGLLTVPLFEDLGKSTTLSRIAGRLTIDGKDISEQMVREGFATKEKGNNHAGNSRD